MADTVTQESAEINYKEILARDEAMFGRRDIFTSFENITRDNVLMAVNSALSYHLANFGEEDYLYWRRRGMSPVLVRTKERNQHINNKIIENHPDQIVSFKNGFMLPQPAFYIARTPDKQADVNRLNEFNYRAGKNKADNETVDWFHTVGKGVMLIQPCTGVIKPYEVFALDPRSAFVVYSMRPGKAPVMGVNMVVSEGRVKFDVFTKKHIFRLSGGELGPTITEIPFEQATAVSVDKVEANRIGEIPIVEYRYNTMNMGAFESVLTMCTALDEVASDRLDGLDQFIQSLIVTTNCEFDEGVTASTIKQMGIVPLKSTPDSKADIKILSEELNQSQTQTLADHLYDQMLTICMMPSERKGGASTSDTGAASLYRDGWVQAEACASNTQDLFKASNVYIDRIICKILKMKGIMDIEPDDFELMFNRTEMANIQSKAQSLNTLLASGVAPVLAFAKSGVSNDPGADVKMSEKYLKMIWGDPDKVDKKEKQARNKEGAEGEAQILEEVRPTVQPASGDDV